MFTREGINAEGASFGDPFLFLIRREKVWLHQCPRKVADLRAYLQLISPLVAAGRLLTGSLFDSLTLTHKVNLKKHTHLGFKNVSRNKSLPFTTLF